MKSIKTSSLFRLAALLIIAIIVICMVGFVAQEWQAPETVRVPPYSSITMAICIFASRSLARAAGSFIVL